MATTYDINLRDYWRIVRKKKAVVISTIVMMGLFSFFFANLLKPVLKYEATASVKIEKTTTLAGLILQVVSYAEGDNLATQAKVITSFPIIEIVAQRLQLIDENLTSDEIRHDEKNLQKVLALKSQVTAEVDGFTNIINITATSSNSKFSQKLANTVAEVYRDENIKERNQRITSARKFIERQLVLVEKQLAKSEEELRTFKEKNKLLSFDTEKTTAFKGLLDLEGEHDKAAELLEEVVKVKEQLKTNQGISKEPLPGLIYGDYSPLFVSLHQKLVDLDIKRGNLLEIYTETHPDVMLLDNEIKSVTDAMIKDLTSQEKTLRKQIEILDRNISTLRGKFESLPEAGLILARLERNVDLNNSLYTLLQSKHQESLIQEAEKIEEVKIIRPAVEPSAPKNPPKTMLTGFIGILMGIILGVVFAFIAETMDTSIGTIEDVESYLNIPVLGIIPHIGIEEIKDIIAKKSPREKDMETLEKNARLVSHFAPKSPIAESYRSLRTNIQFMGVEKGAKSILFTSTTHGEGKTTIVINVAITMAQMGHKTLLIDCDLRRPAVHKFFGLDREPGLTDIILGNCEVKEAIKTVTDIMIGQMGMEDIMLTPGMDNLSVINAGTILTNPAELLTSSKMTDFIRQFEKEYDIVLMDTPPVLPAADATILGSKTGGTVLIYQVGKIARGALRQSKIRLENVKSNVFGVVLNSLMSKISPDLYGKYYDYYYYYSESTEDQEFIPKPTGIQKYLGFLEKLKNPFKRKGKVKPQTKVRTERKAPRKRSGVMKKMIIVLFVLFFLAGGLLWYQNINELNPLIVDFFKIVQQKLEILKDQYQNVFKF